MSAYDSPIPLSDIETVLAWVDTFKLSRPTKKINRDFSDAGERERWPQNILNKAQILNIPYIHHLLLLQQNFYQQSVKFKRQFLILKYIIKIDFCISKLISILVLLAEILSVHYPKLVEMHNYPPRNSHSLKLNNWMTLNRKVLKKLRLNLCSNTMEQLANCAPGVIERVLVMGEK